MNPMILEILKRAELEKKRLVKFESRRTVCPVCRFFGFDSVGSVRTLKTAPDGVRYCECSKCGSHFRAIGTDEIEKVQIDCTSQSDMVTLKNEKSKKGAGKNGKHTGRRTKRGKSGN